MQPVLLFQKKPCFQTLLYTPTASTLEHATPCIVDMAVHIVVLLRFVDLWRLVVGNICAFSVTVYLHILDYIYICMYVII